jgi:prepilin-type processing-associated H-X9-DG protein
LGTGRSAAAAGFARPSSYHPGGLNVLFCDGHVRFMSDKIGYHVYQALMTPMRYKSINNSTVMPFPPLHGATLQVTENELR